MKAFELLEPSRSCIFVDLVLFQSAIIQKALLTILLDTIPIQNAYCSLSLGNSYVVLLFPRLAGCVKCSKCNVLIRLRDLLWLGLPNHRIVLPTDALATISLYDSLQATTHLTYK